jgi:sugar phosphate permease
VIAPVLRDELDLSLAQVGLALAAEWIGLTVTLLPWGFVADRIGERRALGIGLGLCGALVCAAAFAPSFASLVILVALAGAAGGSVQSSSGRAVMGWFARDERGLALGVRQTAVPVGGLVAALALPPAVAAGGIELAFLVLGGGCLAGALVGAIVIRDPEIDTFEAEDAAWTLRDSRLWLLCSASGLYVVAQTAILSFTVLFLVDVRGFSHGEAGAVLAAMQAVGAALRIAAGRWSDAIGSRIVPLRRIGLVAAGLLAVTAAALAAEVWLLLPALVAAGALSMAWNGLSFTAAAELATRRRTATAIAFQQTALSVFGVGVPVAFAAVVAATSWRTGFAVAALAPLAGWLLLAPLVERR